MTRKPSQETTVAWARLMRVQQGLLVAVEKDLKAAGFPPLAWYDALLELARAPRGELRPPTPLGASAKGQSGSDLARVVLLKAACTRKSFFSSCSPSSFLILAAAFR